MKYGTSLILFQKDHYSDSRILGDDYSASRVLGETRWKCIRREPMLRPSLLCHHSGKTHKLQELSRYLVQEGSRAVA